MLQVPDALGGDGYRLVMDPGKTRSCSDGWFRRAARLQVASSHVAMGRSICDGQFGPQPVIDAGQALLARAE